MLQRMRIDSLTNCFLDCLPAKLNSKTFATYARGNLFECRSETLAER